MIELLVTLGLLLIAFGALRCALCELNLYRRGKRDKWLRAQCEAARLRRPIPTAPMIERRERGRLCAGGAWVDPDKPTVINLHDRRGRR